MRESCTIPYLNPFFLPFSIDCTTYFADFADMARRLLWKKWNIFSHSASLKLGASLKGALLEWMSGTKQLLHFYANFYVDLCNLIPNLTSQRKLNVISCFQLFCYLSFSEHNYYESFSENNIIIHQICNLNFEFEFQFELPCLLPFFMASKMFSGTSNFSWWTRWGQIQRCRICQLECLAILRSESFRSPGKNFAQ